MGFEHIGDEQRDSIFSSPPHGTRPFPAGAWTLNPGDTTITVSVRNWWVARVSLALDLVEGRVEVDRRGVIRWISVTVASASVDSGNQRRDRHLRSADFLDADQSPTILFSGRSTGDRIDGELEVKDKKTTLNLIATEATPQDDGAATFAAHGTVDRRKIGLGALPGSMIGHQLEVTLHGRAVPVPPAPSH